jgi:hypothetical protein
VGPCAASSTRMKGVDDARVKSAPSLVGIAEDCKAREDGQGELTKTTEKP